MQRRLLLRNTASVQLFQGSAGGASGFIPMVAASSEAFNFINLVQHAASLGTTGRWSGHLHPAIRAPELA